MPAFLAFVFRARLAGGGRDFIDRTALAAFGLDPGIAFGDGNCFFSIASRISRSASSRIACFDISCPLVLESRHPV